MTWPVAILDFEASGLSRLSYPIEVGFARWRGIDEPIESWGTFIRPELDWFRGGYWSTETEAIHGITQGELWLGQSPADICRRLNAELAGFVVCCDGFAFDQAWLFQLYEAANLKPTFQLDWMIALYHRANPGMARWLGENDKRPHRAREDAVWLMRAFAYGLRCRPQRIVLS